MALKELTPKEIIDRELDFYGGRGDVDVADEIVRELHRWGFVIVKAERLEAQSSVTRNPAPDSSPSSVPSPSRTFTAGR